MDSTDALGLPEATPAGTPVERPEMAAPELTDGDLAALYRRHALGPVRLAVVMLGHQAAAEDVVQEAFLGLYRRRGSLADPSRALAYLRSSVLNGCRTAVHRQHRQGVAAARAARRRCCPARLS